MQSSQLPVPPKGPVPKFAKCLNTADLECKINDQPPFRRANPEGGFLSVCGNIASFYKDNLLTLPAAPARAYNAAAADVPHMQPQFQV